MSFDERNKKTAEALADLGFVAESQIARAMAASKATARRLEETLLELGILPDDSLADTLAEWLGLVRYGQDCTPDPIVDPSWGLDSNFLRTNLICPAALPDGQNVLMMADPQNDDLHQMMNYATGLEFFVCVATAGEVLRAVENAAGADTLEDDHDTAANARDIDQLAQSASEGPIVRLAQQIMLAALDQRASDIHVEAEAVGGIVRFRVNGSIVTERQLNEAEVKALQSRLKIMAGVNISEVRRPQDGRIRQTLRGVSIDFRLSSLPTQFGESLVLRVLDQRARPLELEGLGFTSERSAKLKRLFNLTEGLFLVTGPTGSGKTTTLYTGLTLLDAKSNKIITIEDPIEYTLPNICQTQIQPEIGYDLGDALRAVLRQDINMVLVGEIRDTDTAQNAVRISMTGRLVASTLHTPSAISAVDRMRDLDVPDYLLASTLAGVLSQRLVRRADGAGRVVVSELFEVTPEAAQRIADGMPAFQIAQEAIAEGHQTMAHDGERLVKDGIVNRADLEAVLFTANG